MGANLPLAMSRHHFKTEFCDMSPCEFQSHKAKGEFRLATVQESWSILDSDRKACNHLPTVPFPLRSGDANITGTRR
jgi:hypothetical protein